MAILQVSLIGSEQTLDLRHKVLRPHLSELENKIENDDLHSSFHVGGFADNKLVSIASFFQQPSPDLSSKLPYRLRQMGTLPEHSGQGVGREVFNFGEHQARERGGDLLWCHARVVAFPFYERLGMDYLGDFFDVPLIGPHKTMFKWLSKAN